MVQWCWIYSKPLLQRFMCHGRYDATAGALLAAQPLATTPTRSIPSTRICHSLPWNKLTQHTLFVSTASMWSGALGIYPQASQLRWRWLCLTICFLVFPAINGIVCNMVKDYSRTAISNRSCLRVTMSYEALLDPCICSCAAPKRSLKYASMYRSPSLRIDCNQSGAKFNYYFFNLNFD